MTPMASAIVEDAETAVEQFGRARRPIVQVTAAFEHVDLVTGAQSRTVPARDRRTPGVGSC